MRYFVYTRHILLLWGILYIRGILCSYGVYRIFEACCVTMGYIVYIGILCHSLCINQCSAFSPVLLEM